MVTNFKIIKNQIKILVCLVCFTFIITNFTNCTKPQKPLSQDTEWTFQSQRKEIEPAHWIEENVRHKGESTLALAANKKFYSNGSWRKSFEVVPEKYYNFITHFKPENITQLNRTVFAQIIWRAKDGKRIEFIEFPSFKAQKTEDGWYVIQQKYKIPKEAMSAQVDLFYRWDIDGKVFFGETSFKETDAIKSRSVRLGTIHYRPDNTTSPKDNLKQFGKFITIAGEQNADIVCLPEGITVVSTGKSYVEVSETIPGPTTAFLGQLAKKYKMYIVAGIYEKEKSVVYNTAVLIGRDGELHGKYRKVALPREEIDGGITPGNSFPVFDTDFGKIGMMICWDVYFPEPARMLALQGAEIIFMPIWGGDLTLAKARAIENQIYLVSSSYDMKTGVFDKTGELLTEGTNDNPVAIIEVDLNQRKLLPYLGEFRNRIQRELPDAETINY